MAGALPNGLRRFDLMGGCENLQQHHRHKLGEKLQHAQSILIQKYKYLKIKN